MGEQATISEKMDEGMAAARARVDATYELLTLLERAMKSKRQTVQVMPHGVEVIDVKTDDTIRVVALVDVTPLPGRGAGS
jgi:hypothetical protein